MGGNDMADSLKGQHVRGTDTGRRIAGLCMGGIAK